MDVAEVGDTVYVLYENRADGRFTELTTKLCTLDIDTATFTDIEDEKLVNFLDEYGVKEAQGRIHPTMEAVPGDEKLSICLRGGIIEYGDNDARLAVKTKETIMADTSMDVWGHVFINEDDFLLTCNKVNGLESLALYKYEKTTDA